MYTYNIERYEYIYIYKQHGIHLKKSLKNQLLSTFQLTILDLIPSPRSNPPLGLTLDFQGKPSGSRHPYFCWWFQPELRQTHDQLTSWGSLVVEIPIIHKVVYGGCLGFLKQTNVWTSLIPLPFSNPVRYGGMVWVLRGRWRNPMEIWASSDRRSCRS